MSFRIARPRLLRTLLAIVALAMPATVSFAQADDAARADELFRSGKERMAAGEFSAACPMLDQSYRLDPATGSLLALALCHEREHKFVTARAEYDEALQRSTAEGRADRAAAARSKVELLDSKISTLTVYLTQSSCAATVEVRLNGIVVPEAQLGTKLSVDGSVALVEASAIGKQTWRMSMPVGLQRQELAVTVPVLETVHETVHAPAAASSEPAPARPAPQSGPATMAQPPRHRSLAYRARISGLALMGAGAVGLVLAAGYTVRAAHLRRDSESGCDGNLCTSEGRNLRLDARSAGTAATISVAAGSVLAATGLASFMFGWSRDRSGERRAGAHVRASAWAAPTSFGGSLAGSF